MKIRRLVGLAVIVMAVICGWWGTWRYVGHRVTSSGEYQLRADRIEVTELPEWIRSDVKSEVIRDGGLSGDLSILEDRLTERVAKAFALHPWVAEVVRVSKEYPARVRVELVYRRPVLMVAIPDELVAVDATAVVLPSGDFAAVDLARYPRLESIRSTPRGPAGTPWGDDRVAAAASLADALLEDWHPLDLRQIEPASPRGEGFSANVPHFTLVTSRGSRVYWGSAPIDDTTSRWTTASRLDGLKRYFAENGSLDGDRPGQEIDVRDLTGALPTATHGPVMRR